MKAGAIEARQASLPAGQGAACLLTSVAAFEPAAAN